MLRFLATLSFSTLLASTPLRADPSVMRVDVADASPSIFSRSQRTPMVSIARRFVGASGPQLGLHSRLWCADFANMVRRKAGLRSVPSRRAIDQARYGTRLYQPEPGALMITGRRGGAHVDLVTAVHGDGAVSTIGGNVGKRVKERRRIARGLFIKPH